MRPLDDINGSELNKAIKALNDSKLLDKPIVMIGSGRTKEAKIKDFSNSLFALEEAGKIDKVPEVCIDMHNFIHTDDETLAKEKAEKEKAAAEKKTKGRAKSSECRAFLEEQIESGKFTRTELKAMAGEKFPETAPATIATYLSDAKSEKYSAFKAKGLMVEDPETKKLSFDGKPIK